MSDELVGLRPGTYQGQDGHEYRVFADGSTYRCVYREVVKRDHNGNKFINRHGPTLIRVGSARVKKTSPLADPCPPRLPADEDAVPAGGEVA